MTDSPDAPTSPPRDPCFLCGGPQRPRFAVRGRWLLYCPRCGLGQLAPLPTDEELDRLYASEAYFRGDDRVGYASYVADAPEHARSFRRELTWLLRNAPVRNLLEIGCGPGVLLAEARRLGIADVVGVDPNPWAVREAQSRGIEARLGSIDAIARTARFDAIVMLDVLEHVVAPLPFLAGVRERLRDDGRLLVMTPNVESLLARVSGRRWVSLKVPEHVRYYSRRGIRAVLAAAGFRVVATRSAGQYVTVDFFLDRLARLVPAASAARRLARVIGIDRRVILLTNGSIDVIACKAEITATANVDTRLPTFQPVATL